MSIRTIISREEYESMKGYPDYDQFCSYIMQIVKLAVEESLKILPQTMSHLSKQVDYLKMLSTKFYSENKDLVPHKPLVAKTIEQVESENPGMPYEDILKISATKARSLVSEASKISSQSHTSNIDNNLKGI